MEKIFTNQAYCEWLLEQATLKRPYWYGTCFQKCTASLLNAKKEQYPSEYKEGRMARYKKDIAAEQIAGDCVGGAIKGAAWTLLSTVKWRSKSHNVPDESANGMFTYCKAQGAEYGPIDTMPDRPGVAVRKKGHVGIYVGDGKVVEWRGFDYGCVVTLLKDRPWTDWYSLPWVEYENAGDEKPVDLRPLLKKGAKGEAVKALQERLIELGYGMYLGRWGADGEFGNGTENAVMAFQDAMGLEVDGEVGPKTWAALDSAPAPKLYTYTIHGLTQPEIDRLRVDWPMGEATEE